MDPSWPPQLQLANMNCRNTRCHSTRCRRYIVDAAKCNNTRCNIATCSALTPQPVVPHTCNLHMCGAKTTPQHNFTEHHSTSDVIAKTRVHTPFHPRRVMNNTRQQTMIPHCTTCAIGIANVFAQHPYCTTQIMHNETAHGCTYHIHIRH